MHLGVRVRIDQLKHAFSSSLQSRISVGTIRHPSEPSLFITVFGSCGARLISRSLAPLYAQPARQKIRFAGCASRSATTVS